MPKNRIGFLDFLRGFALYGILVVNLPYFAKPMYLVGSAGENTNLLDSIASWIVAFFFESKFYVLFSFLFGYGISVQIKDWEEVESRNRYLRRMAGLFLIGLLHGIFLFLGDILLSYAILGCVAWLIRKKNPVWLLKFSLGFLLIAILCRMILAFGQDEYRSRLASSLPDILSETRSAYLGSFWDGAKQRATDTFISYPFTILFQWPSILSMFALGIVAGKTSFFERWEQSKNGVKKLIPWLLILGLSGNLIYSIHSRNLFVEDLSLIWQLGFSILDAVSAPALTICYVYWLGIYYHSESSLADRSWFESPGKFSLSNYLGQSVICSWIFCGWGLGFYDKLGNFQLLFLAFPIWFICVLGSKTWSRFFSIGPVETILRAVTYGKFRNIRFF
ncbi:PF04235 family protein [Leptospira broomii serovar Hurstbridge str. 5399]|uniref:PF04235 family protein n=1 Tax=Leptospira broomii serovar Hurstbridge str. 5399 TaxID=1049789 RepID=T0GB35_9LEPT|nr:DUF418 domain-containing protein [Leptospira broomii]EQA44034.1 PF04235 family protein [Leptospira broomii serovar Hurstbridge str. 5399]